MFFQINRNSCCWQQCKMHLMKTEMEILAHRQPWRRLTCSFSQTTVWHGGLHQALTHWREKNDKYKQAQMLQRSRSFTDLLGAHFPLWQDSLALWVYVWLFFVSVVCLILTQDRICHRAQPSSLVFHSSCLIHAVACSIANDRAGSVWP